MKILKFKKDKKQVKSATKAYYKEYLFVFNNDVVKAGAKPYIFDEDAQHCLADACNYNAFIEFTDQELEVIYKSILNSFANIMQLKTPNFNFQVKRVNKLFKSELTLGELNDSGEVEIFVPTKDERVAGVDYAPYLHFDAVNSIIHELYHIKTNNKIYNALKKCLISKNGECRLDIKEFSALANVEQVLIWQNLALEEACEKFKDDELYYDFGFEEVYVRLSTAIQMQSLLEFDFISQQTKDELVKYFNFLIYDEYYNGANTHIREGKVLNKKLYNSLLKTDKNGIVADLIGLYNYVQTSSMHGVNDYITLKVRLLEKQKINLTEIMQEKGLGYLPISYNNSELLNNLYALYYSQQNYKMAQQILRFKTKTSGALSAIKNASIARKIKKQVNNLSNN